MTNSVLQYYVVFYDKYVASVPESWINIDEHILRLPPKNIWNRKLMAKMTVQYNWITKEAKKILGPFDYNTSVEVEKHCPDVSSHEESDAIVERILSSNLKKRHCPKKVSSESEDSNSEDEYVNKKSRISKSPVSGFNSSLKNDTHSEGENEDDTQENDKALSTSHSEDNVLSTNVKPKNSAKGIKQEAKQQSLQNDIDSNSILSDDASNNEVSQNQSVTVLKESDKQNIINPNPSSSNMGGTSIKIISNVPVKQRVQPVYIQSTRSKEASVDNSDLLTVSTYKTYHSQIMRKLNLLLAKEKTTVNINDENSVLPTMPIESVEALEELESLLKRSDVARNQYVEKIKHIGAANEGEFIRNVLRELMIKEVAEMYSWSGQPRPNQAETKKQFKSMKISNILVDTVSKSPRCSKSGSEGYIRSYLQHVGERKK